MLVPKRTKFRRFQKNLQDQKQKNQSFLTYGEFGIVCLQAGYFRAKTIEALRRTLTKTFNRNGKIWLKVFPQISITRKPAEVRMGRGKGAPQFWVAKITAGQILFEVSGVSEELMIQAYTLIDKKIFCATKVVRRNGF